MHGRGGLYGKGVHTIMKVNCMLKMLRRGCTKVLKNFKHFHEPMKSNNKIDFSKSSMNIYYTKMEVFHLGFLQ